MIYGNHFLKSLNEAMAGKFKLPYTYNDIDYIKLGQDEAYIDKEYGMVLYNKSEENEITVKYTVNTVTDEDVSYITRYTTVYLK